MGFIVRIRPAMLAVMLGAVLLAGAGCASSGSSSSSSSDDSGSGENPENTENAATTAPAAIEETQESSAMQEATAEDTNVNDDADREGRVLIRFEGDEGAGYSGSCTANGERESVEGEVPGRASYQLTGDGGLECDLTKTGEGLLRVVLTSGNDRSVYQVNAPESHLSFSYSASGSSSSTNSTSSVNSSSSTGSSSSNSSVTSSNSSSSVVVQQNSSQSSSSSGDSSE